MNSITGNQEILLKKSTKAKPACFRLVFPLWMILLLAACGDPVIAYKGSCIAQTQQFTDYIYSFVIDELNPVITDGMHSGPSADVTKRLEELDARINELNVPRCNSRAKVVKEALRQYMLEARNYFSTVAGRSVYGEGPVQGQWTKMYEAGYSFEMSLEDLQK